LKKFKTLIFKIATIRVIWWVLIYYRGYILIRLKIIDTQWKIVERLKNLHPNPDQDWKITYISPTYGGWDLIIECMFATLEDLESIVSFCRLDPELSRWIETTTTLISTKKNYSD
jgi:hypothetical protein